MSIWPAWALVLHPLPSLTLPFPSLLEARTLTRSALHVLPLCKVIPLLALVLGLMGLHEGRPWVWDCFGDHWSYDVSLDIQLSSWEKAWGQLEPGELPRMSKMPESETNPASVALCRRLAILIACSESRFTNVASCHTTGWSCPQLHGLEALPEVGSSASVLNLVCI